MKDVYQEIPIPYLGESLALITALIWAFAVILFKKSGESVHPIALNVFKSSLAMVLLVPTIYAGGESLFPAAPVGDYLILLFSGVIGIAVADSMFFRSLNLLGASLSAIVDCLYSPFIILLSVLFIGERLGRVQVVGVLLIISAVLTVTRQQGKGGATRHDLIRGTLWGAGAMAVMAVSIVMVKPLLDRSPMLWATEVRLVGGCLALYLMLFLHKGRTGIMGTLRAARSWKFTLAGSFLGAYVAMVLWIGGMKYTQASTAAALNQSSNVFVFLFAALFLKEKMTLLRVGAIFTAVIGVLLVTFG
jgi:drug/metabolite transporter (DMT)-like permease